MKDTVLENLLCWEVNKMFFSGLAIRERGVIPWFEKKNEEEKNAELSVYFLWTQNSVSFKEIDVSAIVQLC